MRFGMGLVVGLLLGTAISASGAAIVWFTGARIPTQSQEFQLGYVAGVYDGFENARMLADYAVTKSVTTANLARVMDGYVDCMDSHRGSTLSDFRNWAFDQWTRYNQSDQYGAAAVMLSVDCK